MSVVLDETENRAALHQPAPLYVIPTDEEKMIAQGTVSHISATAW